jgi:hypothetical protein
LLKLQSELQTWPDSQGKQWAGNVAPLAAWMADNLAAYLSGLREPVRAGTQANTALSITLALDYADTAGNAGLRTSLAASARKFYLTDKTCATQSETVTPAAGRGRGTGAGRGAGEAAVDNSARGAATVNDLTDMPGSSGSRAN